MGARDGRDAVGMGIGIRREMFVVTAVGMVGRMVTDERRVGRSVGAGSGSWLGMGPWLWLIE